MCRRQKRQDRSDGSYMQVAGSMWSNGEDPSSCDKEQCPKRCGMGADGVANGVCVMGVCKCDNGFGGEDCTHMCPQRCSGHGKCEKSENDDKSYHCFCEAPWTGVACDQAAHSNLMVSSMIAVAIKDSRWALLHCDEGILGKAREDKYLAIVRRTMQFQDRTCAYSKGRLQIILLDLHADCGVKFLKAKYIIKVKTTK